jgi:phosphoserine phosphatase RsbU/P
MMETIELRISSSTAPRTLIADDQPEVLEALRLLLKGAGYQTEGVTSPAALLEALKSKQFDLLLMDLNYARDTTSGQEGLDLLSHIRVLDRALPIIVMTGWGSVELAVEAMQRGVRDFVQKPWENERLLVLLRTHVEEGRALRERLRLEKEKKFWQEREYQEAREIQLGLLPKDIPQIPDHEISGAWQPASAVGGDYFDVLKFGSNAVALCVADVAGKGMPAALLMSNLQAAVKAFASELMQPKELCSKVNRVICSNISANRFITFFYGLYDSKRRKLVYTNAGHNAPVLLRRTSAHSRLQEGGSVLGVFREWNYEQREVDLLPGDRIVLFTDGVTEATNDKEEEFGEERLMAFLEERKHLRAIDLRKRVMAAVVEFSGGKFHDDATLIVMSANR